MNSEDGIRVRCEKLATIRAEYCPRKRNPAHQVFCKLGTRSCWFYSGSGYDASGDFVICAHQGQVRRGDDAATGSSASDDK